MIAAAGRGATRRRSRSISISAPATRRPPGWASSPSRLEPGIRVGRPRAPRAPARPAALDLRLPAPSRSGAVGVGIRGAPSSRTQGLKVLFAGESGTGKTMAAQVLGAELGLDLFRVDLATIVSKYIGETEKNLERVFTAADGSNAILFFDEADALFGKRSEVSDSHDRYANIEVAYLLQRMERYPGRGHPRHQLPSQHRRRVRRGGSTSSIDFPFPEAEDRRRIWRLVLPERRRSPTTSTSTSWPTSSSCRAARFATARSPPPSGGRRGEPRSRCGTSCGRWRRSTASRGASRSRPTSSGSTARPRGPR